MIALRQTDTERRPASRALHIVVLWNLAVAQPLLAVLGNSPHLFIAHGASPGQIVAFVSALCLVAPCILALVVAATTPFSPALTRKLHVASVWALAGLWGVVSVKQVLDPSTAVVFVAAAAVATAAAGVYARASVARSFVTWLSPAVVLIPAVFLAGSGISKLVLPQPVAFQTRGAATTDVPVVLIVFDELPLVSLLDERSEIDSRAYPHFARLASDGRWFRNTTAVAQDTFHGIPAILTGRYPEPDRLPIAADHPVSLFTLLADSGPLHVFESGTRLCPESLCGLARDGTRAQERWLALISDVWVVYQHILLPSSQTAALPSLNDRWRDFKPRNEAPEENDWTPEGIHQQMLRAVRTDGLAVFESFLETLDSSAGGGIHYLHTMVTHHPWVHLPSGRRHGLEGGGTPGLLVGEQWVTDEFPVAQSYQRHLSEVAFADRLLGRVIDRLTANGLYDRTLLVVTSDHGSTFRAGDSRRRLTPTTLPEMLPVPLLVKLPGETSGQVSDAPVETIDILPTVAEVLGMALLPGVDGRTLLHPLERRERRGYGDDLRTFVVPAPTVDLMAEPLARKLALFGVRDAHRGARPHSIVGRRVEELPIERAPGLTLQIDRRGPVDVRPESAVLEVDVQGRIHRRGSASQSQTGAEVAIAVNGVIRAVARTFPDAGSLRFAALLPEDGVRLGRNVVDVYEVDVTHDGQVTLVAPALEAGPSYLLTFTEIIEESSRRRYQIEPSRLQGFVDRWENLGAWGWLNGWAAYPAADRPADQVVAFVNGRFAGVGAPYILRPDVAEFLNSREMEPSGFSFDVRPPALVALETAEIRVFALSDAGFASELSYVTGLSSFGVANRQATATSQQR